MIHLYASFAFVAGFACGYGLRALVSFRHRAKARREREWAKGRVIRLTKEEGQTAQETADKSPQTAGLHVAAKDCG
jgi:hypothetical protein